MSFPASTRPQLSYDDITPAQQDAITRLYEQNTLLIAPMGFGKACVAQTAAQELLDEGILQRVLVIAPLKVCTLTWAAEHRNWSHLRAVGMATGPESIRCAALLTHRDIVVINIENVAWFFNTYGADHGFDGLIVDEGTRIKGAGSTAFKALRHRLKDFTWRVCMSADPIAETGADIYTQAFIVDGGAALGRNKEVFQRKYFYPVDYGQFKWRLLPGQGDALALALDGLLYVAADTGYSASLPELQDVVIPVVMPPAAWDAYHAIAQTGAVTLDGVEIEAPTAATVAGKLQQVTAGAVYDEHHTAHWIHYQKFEALDSHVDAVLAAGGTVCIAYNYAFERDCLKVLYPEFPVLGDNPEAVEADWTAGRLKGILLHPKSAAHGLNLQHGGCELFILSAPWGADPWAQLVGRLRRRGQRSPFVRRTTFIIENTIDEVILARHETKAYDSEALNEYLARARRA